MQYINPFHLLNIRSENLSDIDSSTIRRAKNKLIADIELSDNKTIEYKGFELTKSDCIRIIDELDNNDKKEFHFFVFKTSDLNLFLTKGDLSFFKNYKAESIYKLDDFLDFISPYYAAQYSKALSNNYKEQELKNIRHLLFVEPIVNKRDIEDCYKSTYSVIQNIKKEIIQTAKNIENNQSKHIKNDFQDLPKELQKQINVELLNLLPSYFQSVRNQIAQSIRSLSTTINNSPFEVYKPAFEIISMAYNISTDGLVKQSITKGYFIIKGNYDKYGPKEVKGSNKITISNDNNLPEPLKVKFEAKVSKKSIALNEKFRIEFSMNFDGDNFTQPLFNGFNILSGPSQQVSQSWVEGKSVFNKTYSYFLMPKQKGPLTIEAASIEFSGKIYKTDSIKINSPVIFSQSNQSNEDIKEKSRGLLYWSFLCVMFSIGFFYNPVQKIILGISLFTWLIALFSVIKEKLFFKNYLTKNNVFYISCLVSGFFYPIIAQLFMSYYFGIYLITLYDSVLKKNARRNIIYDFMISAVILTFVYNCYLGFNSNPTISDAERNKIEEVADSQKYFQKGLLAFNKSNYSNAIIHYNKAISLNPKYADAFENRGECYDSLKEYEQSVSDYTESLRLDDNYASLGNELKSLLYTKLGASLNSLNRTEEAKENFKKALVLDTTNVMAKIQFTLTNYNLLRKNITNVYNGQLIGCEVTPKYNKKLNNKLVINVGSNASVAVKLINFKTDKCIRYVYINKNSEYSIRNIPEGIYYLKIAYGNYWSKIKDQPDCSGRFTKNTLFEKGEEILDFNLVHSGNSYKVPSFSLKLDVIISDDKMSTFNTDKINENDFYNE